MRGIIAVTVIVFSALAAGCLKPVHFPAESLSAGTEAGKAWRGFDGNHDGKVDFFTFADAGGRVSRIGYDLDGDGQVDELIDLDAIDFRQCRHLVIILDGIGFDFLSKYYDAGGLRMFHQPSRVVSPYPSMTDVSMEDMLGYMPARAFEALHFDRRFNKLVGGSGDYMAGANEPYNQLLHYRADMLWDAIGYVDPWPVFGKEINDAKRIFDKRRTQEVLAYFVSSAGVGTRLGAAGQEKCLRRVEQLVNQVIWETRGLTKVTLLSDHGHSYTPARRIALDDYLAKKHWRIANSLRRPRDVVYVRFGLVTFAGFHTNERAQLAADLAGAEGVELASYADGDAAVVLGPGGGRAEIRRTGDGRYKYEAHSGDPLGLHDILAALDSDAADSYDADELLQATATHTYPAPLQRIWRAHFALVANPPDVIVSLENRFYSGSKAFAGAVEIASTHGSLNYADSVTFIMSTAAPLPPLMRSRDIPANMTKLTGSDWPMGK